MTLNTRNSAALSDVQRERLRSRIAAARREAPAVAVVPRQPGSSTLPVSYQQEQLWFVTQLQMPSAYGVHLAVPLAGPLDRAALTRALSQLVHRHETLRTVFVSQDAAVGQIVREASPVVLPLDDLSGLKAQAQEQLASECRRAECEAPFVLAEGPLFRARLIQFAADRHELLLSFHHIITDGWSIGLLLRELAALYAAVVEGRSSPLPPLHVQFADYAIWQREYLRGATLDSLREYWRGQLEGSRATALIPDRTRRTVPSFQAAVERVELDSTVAARIKTLAQDSRATLFMTLFSAFNVLLHHWTGGTDLTVGTVVANRRQPGIDTLFGCFANVLPIRTRLERSMCFRDVVACVRDACLGAYEHQELPFAMLVEQCAPGRDLGQNPLFQIVFSAVYGAGDLPTSAGVQFGPGHGVSETVRFDMEVQVAETPGATTVAFAYNAELFERATVARLAECFRTMLSALAADPDQRIDAIPLLDAERRKALVGQGRGERSGYPEASLGVLFAAQVAARREAVALECGATRLTYGALDARANQVAQALRRAGVGLESRVGVVLPRGIEQIVAVLGVVKAGGAYVALEVTDPAARVAQQLTDAGAEVVVTQGEVAAVVAAGRRVIAIETVAEEPPDDPPLAVPLDALAYVAFTSGSTGRPKGVEVRHRGVVRLLWGQQYMRLGPEETLLQLAPVSFDASTLEIWGALLHGGRLVIYPQRVPEPAALGAELTRTGVTTAWLTASLYNTVITQAPAALGGLRQLLIGGEALSVPHVRAGLAALPATTLINGYGPTESTTFTCCYPIPRAWDGETAIPLGGPIAHTDVYVLDAAGRVAPPGVAGELYIGGDGLARGYAGAARLTAAKFVPDGVSGAAGARLYRTGDTVRWAADGTLAFLGRRDGQIKLRGYRIELGEVTAALQAVPGVATATAAVHGTGDGRQLVGYVVAAGDSRLEPARVRAALQAHLPGYLVPAAVVVLDALPLTAAGKVDRDALPPPDADVAAPAHVSPRSALEQQIAAVWTEVLGLAQVSVDANFFDIGGHSLRLIAVQAKIAEALDRTVPLVTLFQYPTVAALARHLSEEDIAAPPLAPAATPSVESIAIIGVAGRFPGAPDVERFWSNLRDGVETIQRFSGEELIAAGVPPSVLDDPHYVPARGALADPDLFDAELFGYAPREAALVDPQQRLMLECAWTALENAGYAPRRRSNVRIGVYAGTSANTYILAADRAALGASSPLQVLVASDKDFLATRVSYKLELHGPAVTVQTACSTSLVAVHTACQALRAGECDIALAGGVSVTVPSIGGYRHTPDGIASPDGHCRPFDAQAGGTVAGNGAGIVVLKRLGQAVADGDNVLAVIRGSAVNNDGADKVGFTAPSVNGQAAVIAAAQADAGIPADTITYVEAHGTGTALGDPVEVAALRRVFGDGAGPASCALASVKSNVGHLDAAAGITALIKVVLALAHRELPPSLHFTRPNPQLDLGPFYVPTRLTPWTPRPGVPRRAGVSSFGMGGTNAHVILEEPPDRHAAAPARPCHVLPVSGHSLTAVDAATEQLASWLEAHPESSIADVAFTQQVGRAALRVRRAATGRDASSIAAALRAAPARTVTGGEPALVWLFPGQGTQLVGMGRALYEGEPTFRAEIDACAAALDRWLDRDLRAVLYPASADAEADAEARLAETTWTQVALVSVELALAALWQSWGLRPAAVLGHSVGELAAACVAGALTRESVLQIAATRGRLMHAAPAGGMMAIAGRADEIDSLLGPDLWLAAVNSATQSVVAGTWPALARLEACLGREGRLAQRLPATGAFHSGLMAGVVDPLNDAAQAHTASPPRVPWISTVTGEVMTAAPPATYWGAQVTAPVQWAAAVASARAFVGAAPVWLELGPGHTLTRLVQPLSAGETAIAAMDGADAAAATAAACGQAWAAGADVDWMAYHRYLPRQRLVLPSYPFQRQRYWLEAAPRRDTPASARVEKRSDISQWLYVPTWKQMPPARGVRRDGEHCLLFAPATEAGERLKKNLEARGCMVTIAEPGDGWSARAADHYVVNPAVREDYATLFDALVRADRVPARIVHAWTAEGPAGQESETDRGTGSIVRAVHAFTRSTVPTHVRMLVLSSETQIVRGNETVSPARASIAGLCRVIPQEHPSIGCRCVDIEPGTLTSDAALGRLANELVADADDVVVALRGQWRWVQQFDAMPAATSADRPPALSEGPYLITGGLGRIGLALAEHLARAVRTTLVLVTRSAFPARPDWAPWLETHPDSDPTSVTIRRLAAIEERGSRVLVAQADVTDRLQFAEAVARAEADAGAIRVAIHAAGATAEADFAAVTATDSTLIERHRLPKLRGAEVVREVFRDRPLELCVLMSSLASVLGGLRFGAYAAANESLNRFADLEAAHGRPWISVAWDGWRFADSDRQAPGELAALAMTPQEGVAAFDRILDTGWRGTVIVSTGELAARMRRSTVPPAQHDGEAPLSARPSVETAFVEPRTSTEQVVARLWADSLGIDRVGVDDDFFELGGHSLLGVHLAARLSQELGVTVSLHDVLAHPTVAALSRIAGRLQDMGDVTAGTVARALEAVHQMSEEEVERLLAES